MNARVLSLSLLAGLALCLAPARLPAPPLPAGTTTGLTTLEKYLIDDVTLVGIANVKTVVASGLHTKLKKEAAAVHEHEFFAKYIKPFGVKPIQDIERVVMVMGTQKARERSFGGKREENDERMYFLFQGKFDAKKFEAGFAAIAKDHPKEAKVVGKGATAILEVGNGNVFFSLLDKSTFIIAPSKKIVEEVQARASGKVKAKFTHKDFPAALKGLRADTAIDAIGTGALQVDSKFEPVGKDGYKLTPVTLDERGYAKLTVRVEVKTELTGKVTLEAKAKGTLADLAKKLTAGLEEMNKNLEQIGERDPFSKVVLQVTKGMKVKSAGQAVTLEGKMSQDDAKALLEGMKKGLDDIGKPRNFGKP